MVTERKKPSKSSSTSSKRNKTKSVQTHPSTEFESIHFTGNAKEYFGIWIVNLILSIITLGIYSAWAKVRRETYFNNNTKIFDTGIAYHATGGQIFKGRLIALFLLGIINGLSYVHPFLGIAAILLFTLLLSWIVNNSMRFSARMTSYRNIRFNWHGTYWKTLWFMIIAPIVGLLSLGLLMPLISKSYYSYVAGHHSYGTTNFSSTLKIKQFYIAFLLGCILPTIAFCGLLAAFLFIGYDFMATQGVNLISMLAVVTQLVIYFVVFSVLYIYGILCRNLLLRSLTLGDVLEFDSRINPLKYVWITASNLVLILISLGMLLPWAKVRMYRYLSGATLIHAHGDIETFVDEEKVSQSSFGEAVADFEGFGGFI